MKNIIIAIILSISFIICASMINRYKIIMNNGDNSGLLTIKYDTVTGKTWRLEFPENNWVEILNSGMHYVLPEEANDKENDVSKNDK